MRLSPGKCVRVACVCLLASACVSFASVLWRVCASRLLRSHGEYVRVAYVCILASACVSLASVSWRVRACRLRLSPGECVRVAYVSLLASACELFTSVSRRVRARLSRLSSGAYGSTSSHVCLPARASVSLTPLSLVYLLASAYVSLSLTSVTEKVRVCHHVSCRTSVALRALRGRMSHCLSRLSFYARCEGVCSSLLSIFMRMRVCLSRLSPCEGMRWLTSVTMRGREMSHFCHRARA